MKTDFVEIFQTIRAVLQPYAATGFETTTNSETDFELYTDKQVTLNNEKQKMYFAGVKILENYVALCLKPMFVEPEIKKLLHPDLMSLFKENSCFHIEKLDERLLKLIVQALDVGFTHYKQQGWV